MDCFARVFDGYVQRLVSVPDDPSISDALHVLSHGKLALHKPNKPPGAPDHAPHTWTADSPIDAALLKHIFLCMATPASTLAELHVYHQTACMQIRLRTDETTTLVYDTTEVAAIVRLCADTAVRTIVICSDDPDVSEMTDKALDAIRARVTGEKETLVLLGEMVADIRPVNFDVPADWVVKQLPGLLNNNTGIDARAHFLRLYYPWRPKLQAMVDSTPSVITNGDLDSYEKTNIDTQIPRARARGFMRMTAGDADVDPIYERVNIELFYPDHLSSVPPIPPADCSVDHTDDAGASTPTRLMRAMAGVMHELDGTRSDVHTRIDSYPYVNTGRFMDAWQLCIDKKSPADGMERMLLCEALLVLHIMHNTDEGALFANMNAHAKVAHRLLLFGLMHSCLATRCMCNFLRTHTDGTYNTLTRMYTNIPRMIEQLFVIHDLKGRVVPAAYQSGYMNGSWQRFVQYDMEKMANTIVSQDDDTVFRYYEDRPVWCWNTDNDEGGFDMYDVYKNKKLMYDKLTERRSFVRSGMGAIKNVAAVQSITLMILKVVMPIVSRVSSMFGAELNVDSKVMYDSIFQSTSIASDTDVQNMRRGVWPVDVLFHILHGIVFSLVRSINAQYPLGRATYLLIFLKNIPKRLLLTDVMCALESAGVLPTFMYIGMERSVIDPIAATALKWLVVSRLGKDSWVDIWRNSRVLITRVRKNMLYFSKNELKIVMNLAMHMSMYILSGDDETRQSIARLVALLNPVDMIMEKTMRMVLLWTWVYSLVSTVLQSEMKRLSFV